MVTAILTFFIATIFLIMFLIQNKPPVYIDDERIETVGPDLLLYGTIFFLLAFIANAFVLFICIIASFKYKQYWITILKHAILLFLNVPIFIIYIKFINHYYLKL